MTVHVSRRELEVLELFAEVQEQHREKVVRVQQQGYTPVITHDRAKRRWREANPDKQRVYAERHELKRKEARDAVWAAAYKGPPVACVLCRGEFATKESLTSHWWAKHREQQSALSDSRTVEQLRRQLDRVAKQLAPLETERDRLLEAIRRFGG